VTLSTLAGVVIFMQYRTELQVSLDRRLATRFAALQVRVATTPTGSFGLRIPKAESFAQVLDSNGAIIAATPRALLDEPVLSAKQIARATKHRFTVEKRVDPKEVRARLLVGPATEGTRKVVLVVGTSLDETQDAQRRLLLTLALALLALAVLVSLGGWFVAGAALSPVRSMIEEADEMSSTATLAGRTTRRLTVPAGGEELAALATHLNAMLARIGDAVDHERAFIDDASHELRTPIAIVRAELELARINAADVDTQVALDSALEEVERLERLAANLLVLARTRTITPAQLPTVELGALVRDVVGSVGRAHPDSRVRVRASGSARATGDEVALERAVRNLLDNAIRYAGSEVEVEVGTEVGPASTGSLAFVTVEDDGPGFTDDVLDHAFERFVHHGSAGGGAGLGLAIVSAIARAHGGGVTAANVPGGGARVTMRVPTTARLAAAPQPADTTR
jgi:signal transduction histidine kinase